MRDLIMCAVEGCARAKSRRGWCDAHYRRWLRHGDPLGGGVNRSPDPEETFAMRVERRGDCLVWTGGLNDGGYGRLRVRGVLVRAHRYAWERERGPIPEGLHVDHVCHNRACVEVAHLRLATHAQNEANRSGATASNKSTGIRNVYISGNRYEVRVVRGDLVHRKSFETLEEAVEDAHAARARLFGEFSGRA